MPEKNRSSFFAERRVGLGPLLLLGLARGGFLRLLLFGFAVEFRHLGEDDERVCRVAAQVGDGFLEGGARLAQRHPVRGALALEAAAVGLHRPLAHDGLADDQAGLVLLGDGLGQGGADLVWVVAFNGRHAPAPGLILLGGILVRDGAGIRGELDIVGIVEHDQVAQAEEPGDAACALRNLFLHPAVGDEGKRLVRHPFAEASAQEPLGNGGAYRAGVALAQRPGGVLDPAADIQLGVAGRGAAPLAEALQLLERVLPAQRQHRVEHRRHVARIQEEPVPDMPGRVRGIIAQELGVEDIDEIGPAHRPSRVAGFGLLDHGGGEDADIVGGSISGFVMHVVGRGLLDSRDNYQEQWSKVPRSFQSRNLL